MTLGMRAMPATGAMSFMKSKCRLLVQRRVDRVGRTPPATACSRRRAHARRLRCRYCRRTGPVFDDELLAEPLRKPCAIRRATMSLEPPGGKPTINVPAGPDSFALLRAATSRAVRLHPRRHSEIVGAEISWLPPLILGPRLYVNGPIIRAKGADVAFWPSASFAAAQ